ncbi:MAG: DUF1127 domain-containing protein [Geminicoccaceae bacterium]
MAQPYHLYAEMRGHAAGQSHAFSAHLLCSAASSLPELDALFPIHEVAAFTPPRKEDRTMSIIGRTWQKLLKHREYHRIVEDLQRLDDRMLEDLGIPRHRIEVVARDAVNGSENRHSTV